VATPENSKLYLSPTQYEQAVKEAATLPEDIRLGQWLVNNFGKEGIAYPRIFYLDDPKDTWSNVEVVSEEGN
jgi:hypothetical protein